MSAILDNLFLRQTSETEGVVEAYSDLLDRIVSSIPSANVVLESRQWSRLAAIQLGDCTIYNPEEVKGEDLPFNPFEVAVQITYFWDTAEHRWDLAWVATWPYTE